MFLIANFGTAKAGLNTVGYRVTASGGSAGVRITAGISEISPGVYGADVSLAATFAGHIKWDTGEGSPAYAVEEINLSPAEIGDIADDVAAAVVSQLGGVSVTLTSPVAETGQIILYQGDDYDSDESRAIIFSDGSGSWVSLSGGSVALILKSRGGVAHTISGSISNAGTASQSIRFEIPASQFSGTPKNDAAFKYFAVATLSNSRKVTLTSGRLTVIRQAFE